MNKFKITLTNNTDLNEEMEYTIPNESIDEVAHFLGYRTMVTNHDIDGKYIETENPDTPAVFAFKKLCSNLEMVVKQAKTLQIENVQRLEKEEMLKAVNESIEKARS
jgi:hypothetical protein